MKYRMMWEALKETAEVMIADGIVGEVSWRTLLDLMQQGEKMFEPEERSNERTFLMWLEICEVTGGRVIWGDEVLNKSDNCPFMEDEDGNSSI